MTTVPAIVVRRFETSASGTSSAPRYRQTLELPAVPVAGHRLTVPGSGPLVVDRVILHARRGWAPGLLPIAVEVELEPEPGEALAAAVARGWEPVPAEGAAPPPGIPCPQAPR